MQLARSVVALDVTYTNLAATYNATTKHANLISPNPQVTGGGTGKSLEDPTPFSHAQGPLLTFSTKNKV